MRRGEIWWATLPEPSGHRPVVLISRHSLYASGAHITVAEITTAIRLNATEVALGKADGLARPCVINTAQLFTMSRDRLDTQITSLSPSKIVALDTALAFALGLD